MPLDPEYTPNSWTGVSIYAHTYGAEYVYPLEGEIWHNVPCTVCYTSIREVVLMIPAKTS